MTVIQTALLIAAIQMGLTLDGTAESRGEQPDTKVRFNLWILFFPDEDGARAPEHARAPLPPADDGDPILAVAALGAPFEIEGRSFRIEDGVVVRLDEDGAPGLSVLAAPSLVTVIGQEAELAIGTQVPYMVRNEDGTLTEELLPNVTEGVTVRLLADDATEARVSVERLDVELRQVIDREPIDGVMMRVGRPVIKTTAVSTALVLSADHLAVLALPRAEADNEPVFAIVQASKED